MGEQKFKYWKLASLKSMFYTGLREETSLVQDYVLTSSSEQLRLASRIQND